MVEPSRQGRTADAICAAKKKGTGVKRIHQVAPGIIGCIARSFRGNSTSTRHRWLVLSLPFLLLTTAEPAVAERHSPAGDIVVRWNQELTDTIDAGVHPSRIRMERSYAMLHAAMFDAVNAIERGYTPFRFTVPASRGASSEAAAAQAAYEVLVALYPAKETNFHRILSETLAGVAPGRARQGTEIGKEIAAQLLAWRQNDGWDVPSFPLYDLSPFTAGEWRPTPPALAAAAFTQYPSVLPFATASSTQFLVPPPPSLNSAEYTAAYNEVKELGAVNSATRTADQTEAARVHASLGTTSTPPKLWNGIAQDVTLRGELGLLEAARLFALMNVTIHDALQTSFTGKYTYGLWRPVTAIRNDDGNPTTVQETTWTPLVNAPPYPTYPGNAAAYGASAARALAIALGTDDVPLLVKYPATKVTPPTPQPPDIYRSYSGFWDLAEEMAQCRIWAGIHFTFDSAVSQEASVRLADWVAERYMVPR